MMAERSVRLTTRTKPIIIECQIGERLEPTGPASGRSDGALRNTHRVLASPRHAPVAVATSLPGVIGFARGSTRALCRGRRNPRPCRDHRI
jgi:hypothetical protein